jgi:hypothetical protein
MVAEIGPIDQFNAKLAQRPVMGPPAGIGAQPSSNRVDVFFPLPAIERHDVQKLESGVKAPGIDVVAARVGAGPAEGMDAACFAKPVLRCPGIETIGRKVVLALQKDKVFRRCDEVDESLFRADRAIARQRLGSLDSHPETDTTAVAAAFVPGCRSLRHLFFIRKTRKAPAGAFWELRCMRS